MFEVAQQIETCRLVTLPGDIPAGKLQGQWFRNQSERASERCQVYLLHLPFQSLR